MDEFDRPRLTLGRLVRIFATDMAILVIIAIIAEIALRLVAPQPVHRLLTGVYDIQGGRLRYKPNVTTVCNIGFGDHEFSTNKWRCRDRDYGPKQPGEYRILCLGDSFNENQALDVDRIYTNVLEQMLADRYGPGEYSVVNAGKAGWNLWNYYIYTEEMAEQIQPDLVIAALSVLGDTVRSADKRPQGQPLKLLAGLPVKAEASITERLSWGVWYVNQWLECQSHLYAGLRRWTYYPCRWLGLGITPRFHPICTDPAAADKVRRPTAELLKKLKQLCARHGAELAVMGIPRVYQYSDSDLYWKIQLERPDVTELDMDRPRRLFESICSRAGVPCYDPTSDLAAADQQVYFDYFRHWNRPGNRIVAQGLMEFLHRENLLGR